MINAEQILKRFDRMKADHQLWEAGWQEIADYIFPRHSQFTTKRTPGQKQTEKLFDSTAPDAHERLASTLGGTLNNRATEWFSFTMSDAELNEDQTVSEWLEDCTKRTFRALNQSNFAQENNEVYAEETAFGTAGIFVDERSPEKKKFSGLVFRSLPLNNLYIDEDFEGRVNTVFRWFQLSAAAALDEFGKENLGEKVLKAIEDGKSDTPFSFLHCVYPRNQYEPVIGTPATDLPWVCFYMCIEDKKPLRESGYHEMPIMVPRWSKSPGEKYGRGPGHIAIPDVKTLNEIKKISLKAMGKALDPPTMSQADGIDGNGKVNNKPGGNTVVANLERGVVPLFPPGTFREALGNEQMKSSELVAAIKRYFYADLTELPDKSYMTAFEVRQQVELLQRKLGPVVGRQETELCDPLLDRVFGIMLRHGAYLPTPQILLDQGANIDVQYEGPLARSQRLVEVDGLDKLDAMIMGIAQIDPSVVDNIDYDKAIRGVAQILGVSSKWVRDADEVAKMRADRAKQQAEMQKLNNTAIVAEAMGKAAPALKLMPGAGQGNAAA